MSAVFGVACTSAALVNLFRPPRNRDRRRQNRAALPSSAPIAALVTQPFARNHSMVLAGGEIIGRQAVRLYP